jgi:hypothetical protein
MNGIQSVAWSWCYLLDSISQKVLARRGEIGVLDGSAAVLLTVTWQAFAILTVHISMSVSDAMIDNNDIRFS